MLGCAISAIATPAAAQSAPSTEGDETAKGDAEIAEITVTGTRIKSNGYDQPTAVAVATAQTLQASSPGTISDGLVKLPQFNGSTSRTFCCQVGALGNFLNLRALGSARTLILLDGQRVVPTRETGDVDTNLLPELLIKNVDIVTGGASAAYGSDAVSGVINYVVDNKFVGLRAAAQYGVSNYGDDASVKLGIAGGFKFADDRGHMVISVEHYKINGIPSLDDRPDSRRGGFLGGNGSAAAPFTILEGVNQITATDGGVIVNAAGLPVANAGAPLAGLRFLPGGATTNFIIGTPVAGSPAFAVGGDGFRNNAMQPAGSLRTEKLYSRLSYDLTDNLTAYVRLNAAQSFNHMRILSDNRSAAASYTIFRNNAYLPAAIATAMDAAGVTSFRLGRFNRDFGTINLHYKNQTFDVLLGLEGKLGGRFSWSASYSHGETTQDGRVENVADLAKSYAAADAVVDPGTGQIVCNVTLTNPGAFPGCVPLNPFGVGAPSDAAKAYILGTSTQYVKNTQDVFALELQGKLVPLPGGDLQFAVGGEYRKRSLLEKSNPIALSQIQATGIRGMPGAFCPTLATCRFGGWNQGNFGEADASDDVKEGFVEIQAPLFKDSALGKALDLNGAYRLTDYKNSGSISTWKLGATYEPIDGLRFRVTRSRDIRAPNLFELFAGPVNSFTPGLTDPVTHLTNVIAITRTQGNPGLKPERADTLTLGVVYSPPFIPGLRGSVDYYDINLNGALAATTAQGTLDGCAAGNAAQCALITRDPITNNITQIVLQQINLNGRRVKGIDFDLSYNHDVGGGKLGMRVLATHMIDFTDRVGTTNTQLAGFFNAANNIALPKWRGNLQVTYDIGKFSLFAQERYIGGYNQLPFIPGNIFAQPHVKATFYTDLTLKAKIDAGSGQFEIYGTVNNLFNQRPPFLPNRFAANLAFPTVPGLYDLDNRYFTVGVKVGF
ncbi:MAG: TonB-dependent receptor domain-containing protein [Pseudomonadota bacterium]